mmetsp:Transcript_61896/g.133501  ORF Transcript_61896/g.133501 Transcript_61896/m.133501 type:complete len:217 (+) Transcript_61896:209-859(+)
MGAHVAVLDTSPRVQVISPCAANPKPHCGTQDSPLAIFSHPPAPFSTNPATSAAQGNPTQAVASTISAPAKHSTERLPVNLESTIEQKSSRVAVVLWAKAGDGTLVVVLARVASTVETAHGLPRQALVSATTSVASQRITREPSNPVPPAATHPSATTCIPPWAIACTLMDPDPRPTTTSTAPIAHGLPVHPVRSSTVPPTPQVATMSPEYRGFTP